jgi:phage/conjugal plasmid C-4 type zinc finger TraR family protein
MEKTQLEARIARILRILDTQQRLPGYQALKLRLVIPHLKRAIEKVEEGTYGLCDDCTSEIPKERLRVVPGTTRCVECQQRFETSCPNPLS